MVLSTTPETKGGAQITSAPKDDNMLVPAKSATEGRRSGIVEAYILSKEFPTETHPALQALAIAAKYDDADPNATCEIERSRLRQDKAATAQALAKQTPADEEDTIPLYVLTVMIRLLSNVS